MNISVIIDVVILAALIVFAAMGWKRGLIRTLTELAVVVLSVGLATQIARSAAPKIIDGYLRPATHAAIEQQAEEIAKEAGETTRENLSKLMEAIPNEFVREKAVGAVDSMFPEGQGGYAAVPLGNLGKELADHVLDTLVKDLIQSLLSAALFFVIHFVMRLIAKVLRVMEKLPGVREVNELGGALIGLGKGLVLVCLAVWVLSRIGTITPEIAEGSIALGLLPQWLSVAGK